MPGHLPARSLADPVAPSANAGARPGRVRPGRAPATRVADVVDRRHSEETGASASAAPGYRAIHNSTCAAQSSRQLPSPARTFRQSTRDPPGRLARTIHARAGER